MKIKLDSDFTENYALSIGSNEDDNYIIFTKISYSSFILHEKYFDEVIKTIEEFKKFKKENSDKIKL